jgi:ASC-1-like (ASCH) protein
MLPPLPREPRVDRHPQAANDNSNRKRSHSSTRTHAEDSRSERSTYPCSDSRNVEYRGRFFERGAQHHVCNLKNKYIQFIAGGQKTYEGRVSTRFFEDYNVGDTVTWSAGPNEVTTRITSRQRYANFRDMLIDTGYKNMVPDARSLEDAVRIYNEIPGYQDKATRFGVIAMGVEVCEPQLTASSSSMQAQAR